MQIVYLHQYFNTLSDAGGTRSYECARRLAARGHTVHMVTSRRQEGTRSAEWEQRSVDGVNVHAISVPYSNDMAYRGRIRAFARFAYYAARRAAALDADVVFATSAPRRLK